MAKQFPNIGPSHREFIERQRVFFTASAAAAASRVNVSPKDAASLRLLDERRVVYLDQTGSGNETSAHIHAGGRLTLMFCAFECAPMILRLYGKGRVLPRSCSEYAALLPTFNNEEPPGARQMILLEVDLVQTSCGFGVPLFDYQGGRDTLRKWAASRTPEQLEAYRREKNSVSIDGLPTGPAQ